METEFVPLSLGSPKTPRGKVSSPKTPRTTGDRFIPSRSAMNFEISHFNLTKENSPNKNTDTSNLLGSPSKDEYREQVAASLFPDSKTSLSTARVLSFKSKAPTPNKDFDNIHRTLYSSNKVTAANKPKVSRHIPNSAERVLDAPGFVNDYYLNLIDWSSQNVVAVALSNTLYLWNAANGQIVDLMRTRNESDIITSVSWTKDGRFIALGLSDGTTELWDAEAKRALRALSGHAARVSALSWNSSTLSSGSKDTTIQHHDVRIQNHVTATLEQHTQEICGLKWSDDGLKLASGGNDNIINIWDVNQSTPRFTFNEHQAAVKALSWCPWQRDLLASGGGSADRTLRFWNTSTGTCINSIDTYSQISSILWSTNCKELVSAHGYSQNQLCVWKYPSLTKVAELAGHSDRILCMAMSPDGRTVLSASADETLRFWRVFDVETASPKPKQESNRVFSLSRPLSIR